MEEYEDITDEVKEWLKAVQNKDTAEFLGTGCIKITNGDVLFGVGDTSLIDILDISVFVTPLQYKNIERHKIYRDNIEEAIRAHATSHDYAVRSILWKPLMKNKERVEREIAGQKISNFLGNSRYIKSQINLMNSNATQKPYLAIGIAKELIESCCKDILQHANVNSPW